MTNGINDWIDKEIKEVSKTILFKKYFDNVELTKGEKTYYLTNKQEGIEIAMPPNLIIDTVHLFSEGYEGSKNFNEELPFKIKFSYCRNDVRKILGQPNKSGGGHKSLYIGHIPYWDKYFFETYTLHFTYSESKDSIDMITIASLKLEEYFNSASQ